MQTKEDTARRIAELHYFVEDGIRDIFRIRRAHQDAEEMPSEPVKLLEINRDTIAAGVMPLGFAAYPDRGILHPSVIVEITPEEFDELQAQQLTLPAGWVVGERIPRVVEANGEK